MADIFRTLIVTSDDAPLAREIAACFGPGGQGMWTTPLSSDGNEPAMDYISSGYIPEEFAMLAPCATWTVDADGNWVETAYYPGDPEAITAYANQAGLDVTLSEVKALLDSSDVSEQEPFVAMGRLGLKIVNPPEPLE